MIAEAARRAPLWTAGICLALGACSPAGPRPMPPPHMSTGTAPSRGADGQEIASDGNSTVTVLARPDHPLAQKRETAPEPMTDAKCRALQICAEVGKCSAAGTECVAKSWSDCQQMRACAHGKCTFSAGGCQAVASCKLSRGCQHDGLCADKGDGCIAADAADCKASLGCQREGICSLRDDVCVASDNNDCRQAAVCVAEARCLSDGNSCKALSDAECKRAPVCKEQGRCLARDGMCVKSCADSALCKTWGKCGERKAKPGQCVAVSDKDCEGATACAAQGLCTRSLQGSCEAGDDVECRRSQACREDGRCTATRGQCRPASDAECANAVVACKREGRCRHQRGRCVR